jgi:hypothetical protein
VEQESGQPIYWNDTSDGSTPVGSGNIAARFGGNFSYSSQHLLGSSALKFEVGHRQAAGATVTLNASGEGAEVIESYATRMWNDLTLESSANLGLNYQQGGFSVRSGLTPKLDLAKVDGFTDFGKELRNVFELDAYSELSYRQPRGWSVGLMGTASLTHPGVVQVGAFSQYQFNPQLALATTISADLDPILGNRAGINTGVQYQPLDWIKLNAHAGIGIDQQPMIGLNITGRLPGR